jgi:FKBP-type peptidyl-prolyl cis-trans isomerase SlyD
MRLTLALVRFACAVAVLFAFNAVFAAQPGNDNRVVKDGSIVSLQYTLTGDDGKVIDSNKGKAPLKYVQGQHQIVPGLEREMAGMKVGGEKHVKVKPEDGYGPVDPRGFMEYPREEIPANGLKVGAVLMGKGPQGQPIRARVKEIKEKTVVVDMNHPMAGKNLIFDVKVLDIESPPPAQPTQPSQPAAPPQPGKPAQAK